VQVRNAVVACNQLEVNAVEDNLEQNFNPQSLTATADVSQAPEVPPLPEVVSVQTAVAANQALPAESVAGPSPSPLHFLQLWSRSFLADVRSSSRQFRRALRLFETQRLNPFIRDVRRQLHQFRVRASRLPSHPRWKPFRARAVFASHTSWTSFVSAMPPWLARALGINSHAPRKRVQSVVASRVKRRRGILSLRRWLHEPLTTQQKRTHGHQG